MESPNTSPQMVELNPRYSGQTHANRTGTGPEYKDMEPGSILTVLCIPFMVCPLTSADAKSSKVVQTFCTAGTIGRLDLSLLGKHLRTHLEDHARYDQVSQGECHSQSVKLSWLDP